MSLKFVILVIVLTIVKKLECARILGVVPVASYSHQMFFRPIWRELSLRGHQVTVLTTNPMNNKTLTNLTEIDLHGVYETWNLTEITQKYDNNMFEMITEIISLVRRVTIYHLEHPEVRKLIENKTEHFDLLMVENLIPEMFAFSARFKCPFIGIVSMDGPTTAHETMGNPTHPVMYPDFQLPMNHPLNLVERIISVLFNLFTKYIAGTFGGIQADAHIKKYFGDNYPSIWEIERNRSMLFINTSPAFGVVRPLAPNTIAIGGTHIDVVKPLRKDIQKFLDNAKEGAIYFSLGTNVKSKHVTGQLRSAILDTLKNLPYKVLWKFEENITVPENIKIVQWCAQQGVLRHPNVKLFITQGGLQSLEEAIMSRVPLIGMPFLADQELNVKKIVQNGIGLAVDRHTVTKEILSNAINEVINNIKYKDKVSELADIALDQPMTGLEKAIWWTEYVLRHKGAEYLKTPKIPTYQYYLLDVIFVLVSVPILIVWIIVKCIKIILAMCRGRKLKQL